SFVAPPAPHSFPTRRSSDLLILRARATTDPHRLAGTASAVEIARAASPKALVKKAATLRPSLTGKVEPQEVGYLLGHGKGGQVRSEEHTSELQSRFDLVCRL